MAPPRPSELPKRAKAMRDLLKNTPIDKIIQVRRENAAHPWSVAESTGGKQDRAELVREHVERISLHPVFSPRVQNQALCEEALESTISMMIHVGAPGVFVRVIDNKILQYSMFTGRITWGSVVDSSGITAGITETAVDFLELLHATLSRFKIPDAEFILNLSPLPVINADGVASPLFHKHNHYAMPLPPKYQADPDTTCGRFPVLSRCTRDGTFADLLYPWGFRVKPGKPWETRKHCAVFRGDASGPGVSSDPRDPGGLNQRLGIAKISYKNRVHPRNKGLLDAGVTEWDMRAKKTFQCSSGVCNPEKEAFPLSDPVDVSEYRLGVSVSGESVDENLPRLLSTHCAIIVDNPYSLRSWISDGLYPFKHYLPVRSDLEDLLDRLRWCRDNPAGCEALAGNSQRYSDVVLTPEYACAYLAQVLSIVAPDEPIPRVD